MRLIFSLWYNAPYIYKPYQLGLRTLCLLIFFVSNFQIIIPLSHVFGQFSFYFIVSILHIFIRSFLIANINLCWFRSRCWSWCYFATWCRWKSVGNNGGRFVLSVLYVRKGHDLSPFLAQLFCQWSKLFRFEHFLWWFVLRDFICREIFYWIFTWLIILLFTIICPNKITFNSEALKLQYKMMLDQ